MKQIMIIKRNFGKKAINQKIIFDETIVNHKAHITIKW